MVAASGWTSGSLPKARQTWIRVELMPPGRLEAPSHVHVGHAERVHIGVSDNKGPEVSLVEQEEAADDEPDHTRRAGSIRIHVVLLGAGTPHGLERPPA